MKAKPSEVEPAKKRKQQPADSESKPAVSKRTAGAAADFEAALSGRGSVSERLFELANRPSVRVAVGRSYVEVAQDRAASEHSGGVVWETSYFLLRYLEKQVLPGRKTLRVLELGAGCGLLGLCLARLGCEVTLTEQLLALTNLRANVSSSNASAVVGGGKAATAAELSWGEEVDIKALRARGPFDLLVGTDIVFAARLVRPLLETIAAFLTDRPEKEPGSCWLCLQKRDPDAHALLLKEAPKYFVVQELSFEGLPGFEAACELECMLLNFRMREDVVATSDSLSKATSTKKRSKNNRGQPTDNK